jgi:DNA-binding LacI/PurR family transcriptional regulator
VRWGSLGEGNIGVTVGSDNFGAGRMAGEHLLGLGRKRIAFLGHADEHYPEFADRYRGLCAALDAAGLAVDPALQTDAITTEEAGHAAARRLLARGAAFDGLFAASDLIAIGAMRALVEAGKTIPGDVAVVGFDDIPAASLTNPPLTTLMQDLKGAGETLVETLAAQIEGRDPPAATLPARLIVRRSTAG